ncbi:DUF5681 domain-containing protein [Shimia aestuarii]|uniref:DUF5681 domain-containing protein n=1 Tax=Shimia aestuarii TaxID=254406 RepID=A0A1I4IR79_9RHOB|nr:DUF5681 domain-containing protein [Shimia aestuarii]SFL56804.1 hypothetical protein SAMN04488042_101710 [Shimia aestuarii]
MSEDENTYDVGYRKPPRHTQFKPGQSGNRKGRPKGAKGVGAMAKDTFLRKIQITENGKKKKVTILEALFRQLANGALKGEPRQLDRVLKLLPLVQETMEQEKMAGTGGSGDGPADLAVLEVLADMFGSDPEDLFATIQGGIDAECPEF